MTRIGTVVELWRYPVKSMAGERLERCTVGANGIPGDRGYALRDDGAHEIRGAKKLPVLMQCAARYPVEPTAERVPPAEITLPDGTRIGTDHPEVHARLSAVCGRPVTVCGLRPADDVEHYRSRIFEAPDVERELRAIFGRLDDEPLPDLTGLPPELLQYGAPLGTYFDVLPLHLLTTTTLTTLARHNGSARFDVRRFRPNVLIALDGPAADLPETAWAGRTVHIGEAEIAVHMPTPRCVMTTHAQGDLPKDPSVLRTIVRQANQNVGVYASPSGGGAIRVGDPVSFG